MDHTTTQGKPIRTVVGRPSRNGRGEQEWSSGRTGAQEVSASQLLLVVYKSSSSGIAGQNERY